MSKGDISQDPRVHELLAKYSDRRDTVEGYIGEMEVLKEQVASLFPTELNHRSKFVLEEKIKASASFFQTLLSLTMEYNKSIVTEIDILRKMSLHSDGKERDLKEIIALLEKNEPDLVDKMTEASKDAAEQITIEDPPEIVELKEELKED